MHHENVVLQIIIIRATDFLDAMSKKKSIGNKISFIGFCVAGVGYFSGLYIYPNVGAIIIWIGALISFSGILKTWFDIFFGDG